TACFAHVVSFWFRPARRSPRRAKQSRHPCGGKFTPSIALTPGKIPRHGSAMPGSFTRDEYDRAKKLGRKLFGDQMNIFLDTDAGLWHFGRFLDNGPPISSKGNDPLGAPHRRPQEVFGVGATLTEAMAFVEGPK